MANEGKCGWSLRTAFSLLVLCVVVAPTRGGDDSRDLLLRASQNVVDTVGRLPKYVCTQTIDRDRYEPDRPRYGANVERRARSCDDISAELKAAAWKRRLSTSDRLRLDVAVSQEGTGIENEMYSWAGEDHFSDRDLFELVHDGALSTGSFASILASIFGGKGARFSYNGDSTVDGRLLSEFGFRIPEEESDYLYVFGSGRTQQKPIAYRGTFLVDPETADLVRLVIRAGQLPKEAGACELSQTLDYGRVRLNGADFLLPTQARLSVTHVDETEAENVIRYSACHQFQGESTVRFTPSRAEESPASGTDSSLTALTLPPGLPFQLSFIDRIDPTVAAAGDPIRAKLKTAIRDHSKVLVPEGSAVTARILSIKRFYGHSTVQSSEVRKTSGQQPSLVITIRLDTLETGGVPHPFKAALDSRAQRFAKITMGLSRQVDLGPLDRSRNSDAGVFEFWKTNPDSVVEFGPESNWLTLAP
jgi:hypothetical protein